jgi:hypothetical protein
LLSIVGSCYLMAAFGFLAGSAGFRRGWDATPEVRQQITDYGRRVLVFAAGVTGLAGMLFQFLGQLVMAEHGAWFVIACLALVPVLLGYVFLGDHMLEGYRRVVEGAQPPAVNLTGSARATAARMQLAAVEPGGGLFLGPPLGSGARNAAE